MISSKINVVVALTLGVLLIGGCGVLKKKQPEPAASASQAAVPTPPPVTPPPAPAPAPEVTVADEAIASPEDFEDEAFEKVSDKTYKSELDALKKEIEAK
ncbi:MAG TPA: hypothetical protein VJN18_34555 [Polyangiaceae bacterium]|nr:hypothetical protein [Polyangiaceae bacterium]